MIENKDYELIPVDHENEQAWEIRILDGEFIETVIRYGNVSIDGKAGNISFNFNVTYSPIEQLSEDDRDLQLVAGEILGSLLDNAAKEGHLLFDDKK